MLRYVMIKIFNNLCNKKNIYIDLSNSLPLSTSLLYKKGIQNGSH